MNKLSLFSGIGGDDIASEWVGIKTLCFSEIDPFCQRVLRKHWKDVPIIGDVRNVTKQEVKRLTGQEYVDIVSGGDPCQPRSVAGKRLGEKDDRDLWKFMLRIVQDFKPAWVINENPTGRITMDFGKVLSDLESLGYETRSFIIPACAVNAIHRRERLFIVAHSNKQRHTRGRVYNEPSVIKPFEILSTQLSSRINSKIIIRQDFNSLSQCCKSDNGIPRRVARQHLAVYGNAVVPQQIYPIYRAIVEIEQWEHKNDTSL